MVKEFQGVNKELSSSILTKKILHEFGSSLLATSFLY